MASPYEALVQGGAGGWLNVTRPLTREDMQGRLILLDFWTYGCINCMQVIPDLEYLEHKFGSKILIVGVHSAKFKGEQGSQRILQATQRFGLKHPVINDSDYAIWKSYKIKAWPTLVLLGPDGTEIARYVGEGQRTKLEHAVEEALPSVIDRHSADDLITETVDTGVLSYPSRIEAGPNDTLFIADSGHHRILAADQNGKILFAIGSGERGLTDGPYDTATFNLPRGLAVIGDMLYVADSNNHALRQIDLKKRIVVTIAGNGDKGTIASPWDIEPINHGQELAIAMAGRHQIWGFRIKDKKLYWMAGSGIENIDDGPAKGAALAQPSGIATDGQDIFFVDAESSALRILKGNRIQTLIGAGLFEFGLRDGTYPEARLQHPQGLAVTTDKIYIADTYNDALRVYDRGSTILSTLRVPDQALSEPGDVMFYKERLWIADTNHHAIKIYDPATQTMHNLTLQP